MQVKQIHTILNSVTQEVLGKTDLIAEDLSNIIDVGNELFSASAVDNYVKALVDRIGKVIFVNRPYAGGVPSVLMDSWDFGSVVQKVSAELPEARENKSWELTDGTDYSPNVFYKPTVSTKFFNNKVTFEIDMSFTERQVKESFSSATEINSFLSMLYNAVEKSFTVKIDGLIMRTINNMIGETLGAEDKGIRAVNLLTAYNTKFGTSLTAEKAITDKEFIRYASMQMALYSDRMSRISTLFNIGGKDRFTSADMLHIIMLSDFKAAANSYLQSDTFNKVSAINVKTSAGKTVQQSGIIAVMFDRDALGVSNLERRVTTNYNAKAEFYNNFFKMECGAFNDLNENFVVFYVANPQETTVEGTKG